MNRIGLAMAVLLVSSGPSPRRLPGLSDGDRHQTACGSATRRAPSACSARSMTLALRRRRHADAAALQSRAQRDGDPHAISGRRARLVQRDRGALRGRRLAAPRQDARGDHLASERGVRLGVSQEFVIDLLGLCFTPKKTKGGRMTIRYETEDPDHPFLKRVGMPNYFAEYTFRNNRLVAFRYGSDYP